MYSYAELQPGKAANFCKFVVLWFFAKFFSPRILGGMAFLAWQKQDNLREFSPRKSYFSSIRQVFSLQSFRCTVLPRLHDPVADWISGKDQRLAQRSYSLARCG